MNKDLKKYLQYILFGVFLMILPIMQQNDILISNSNITVIGTVLFYSIVGIGLNVLLGYSGLVSLGTAGFMGFGAYLTGYFSATLELNFFLSVFLAMLVPSVLGAIVGLISLRLEGYYLAIATLGFAEVLKVVFVELEWFTGGFSGLQTSYPSIFDNFDFFGSQTSKILTYDLIVVVLVILLIVTYNFIHSATGRALLTMKGSQAAAQAMGINLFKYKLIAFIVSTVYAALGGALYMAFIRSAYPATWTLNLSLQILAVVVIGGVRTITGPIFGAFVVFGIPELVFKNIPLLAGIDGLSYIFTGILIIVVILFYPNGLIYLGHDVKKWYNKLFKKGDKNQKEEIANE